MGLFIVNTGPSGGTFVAIPGTMRPLARTFVAASFLLLPLTASAQTLTIRDLVALHQSGLGEDVLIALIEVDKPIFTLFPNDVLDLRKQGLTDRVIVKMIETRKVLAPAVPAMAPAVAPVVASERQESPRPPAPAPPVVVEQTVVQEVRVEAPRVRQEVRRETEYIQVPVYVPAVVPPRIPVKEPEPVYWGYGGKRRPDAWQDAPKTTSPPKPTTGGGGGF
jgi:hypothetical protein